MTTDYSRLSTDDDQLYLIFRAFFDSRHTSDCPEPLQIVSHLSAGLQAWVVNIDVQSQAPVDWRLGHVTGPDSISEPFASGGSFTTRKCLPRIVRLRPAAAQGIRRRHLRKSKEPRLAPRTLPGKSMGRRRDSCGLCLATRRARQRGRTRQAGTCLALSHSVCLCRPHFGRKVQALWSKRQRFSC